MRTWHRLALSAGALTLASIAVPRLVWFRRRRLPMPPSSQERSLSLSDGSTVAMAHLRAGHDCLVITAHGLLKGMNERQMVLLAEALLEHFDVLTFDFAGHGRSSAAQELSFGQLVSTLVKIVEHARTLGYRRIGLVGYSMGAAAAIVAASERSPVDAVVSVSCPLALSNGLGTRTSVSTRSWSWWARLMGTRVAPRVRLDPYPIERVGQVSPTPLLIVHNGLDTLVRRDASEALFAVARPPKDYYCVPDGLHAWPMASVGHVTAWLRRQFSRGNEPARPVAALEGG